MQKNNLKVLVVAIDFLPKIGGISTMVHHFCNALVFNNIEVTLLAPSGSRIPEEYAANYKLFIDENSNTNIREGRAAKKEDDRIQHLLEKIYKELSFTRIILMHPYYYGLPTLNFSLKARIPLTSVFYGYELNALLISKRTLLEKLKGCVLSNSIKQRTFKIIKKSNEIIAISNYTGTLVKKVKKNVVIKISGCGISQEDFHRELLISSSFDRLIRVERRNRLNINDTNKPMLIFVGRLVESKNVALIIKALKHMPEVNFAVVGDGPENTFLQQLAKERGVSNQITWLGEVSEEYKWDYLRAADVFILASQELPTGQVEGFGIVLLEATAAGVPVMAAKSGGMIDVVNDNVNGFLFDPTNEEELAEKVRILIGDDKKSYDFVANARSQIKQKFNWNTIVSSLIGDWN
ncbi:MAG: glycosyltransferase family 4 protein [Flavobacteriales bacterium]